jgi:hypothetical protein
MTLFIFPARNCPEQKMREAHNQADPVAPAATRLITELRPSAWPAANHCATKL